MTASKTQLDNEGHRARLKQRFAKDPPAMEDYEILELLLGYALTRKDTKPLAKELLQQFGSLRGVLDARQEELATVTGFGPGTGMFWRLLRELMARYVESPARRREALVSPESVARMARMRLAGSAHEEVWVALLNRGNELLAWERLMRGNLEGVLIQPRDVLEKALQVRACAAIVVHNHPGGSPLPSTADHLFTEGLKQMAPRMGVRFIDHIIVTDEECYSVEEQRIFLPSPPDGAFCTRS